MTALDERLRQALERSERPADPSGVYEDLIRRRERRRISRKVQAGLLATFVVVGTAAGLFGLSRVFGGHGARGIGSPTSSPEPSPSPQLPEDRSTSG